MDHQTSGDAGPEDEREPLQIGDAAVEQELTPTELRLRAVIVASRFYGVELDLNEYRPNIGEPYPSPASLVGWLRDQGMIAKAMRLKWKNLFRFRESAPVVLLLKDGTAGLVVGADPTRDVVWLKSPTARDSEMPVAVDRLRMEAAWAGDVILIRRPVGQGEGEAPFTLGWIAAQVMTQRADPDASQLRVGYPLHSEYHPRSAHHVDD